MTRFRLVTIVVTATAALLSGAHARASASADALGIEVSSRSIQPGEIIRLDVTCTCEGSTGAATATVFGRHIPLVRASDTSEWRGLVGIDVDTRPGTYRIAVSVDRPGTTPVEAGRSILVQRKVFRTRRLQVDPDFVTPPPEAVERIGREQKRLQAIFEAVSSEAWVGPYAAPVSVAVVANFGSRSVFNGQPRSPHGGVDYPSATGTPIHSPGAGIVVLAEDLYFTGNTVVIDHGAGLYSLLAHLSAFAVKAGDRVERDQLVGRVGATGRVTGPHLHWAMRLNNARVDPLALLAVAGGPTAK